MDFTPNGELADGAWSIFTLNGQNKAVGGHVFSIEVAKGTVVSYPDWNYWGYCTFIPYKKRE